MTDTGSMEPIPEAVTWALRADAWSQRPSSTVEQSGTVEGPTGRWSEVATTGRPAFPPDGVGWRSATSEWRSSAESRWRQTTEWRSSTGTSGWRSTTEAWQTGGNSDDIRPPVEPLTRMPAISGTAWPTPANEDPPWSPGTTSGTWQQPDPKPPWQAPVDPQAGWQRTEPATADVPPPWQAVPGDPAPPWQPAADPGSSWRTSTDLTRPSADLTRPSTDLTRPSADPTRVSDTPGIPGESTGSWQSPASTTAPWRSSGDDDGARSRADGPGPSWQTPAEGTASWRTPVDDPSSWRAPVDPRPPSDATPSWRTPVDETPSWRAPVDETPSWRTPVEETPSWRRPAEATPTWQSSAPTWQSSAEPGSSWRAPADDTPSWRQPAEAGPSEAGPSRAVPGDRPRWQGPDEPSSPTAPTSSPWQTPAAPVSSWQTPAAPVSSWRTRDDASSSWRQPATEPRSDDGRSTNGRSLPVEPASGPYGGAWSGSSTYDDGRHLVREDDRAQWRREAAAGRRGADERSGRVGRRRAPDQDGGRPGGTGWATRSDADDWAGHTDTSTMPAFRDDDTGTDGAWRGSRAAPTSAAPTSGPTTGEQTTGDRTTGGRRGRGSAEETRRIPYEKSARGERQRDDEDRGSRRRRAEGRASDDSWRDGDTGPRRRQAPAADPWARDPAETGVGALAWQAPEDTGSWQSPSDTATWRRYIDDPEDEAAGSVRPRSAAASWQSSPERRTRRRPEADDDEPRQWAGTDERPRRRAGSDDDPRRGVDPDGPTRRRARSGPDTWEDRADAPDDIPDDEPPPPPPWRPGQDDDRTQSWRRELQDDLRRDGGGPAGPDATQVRALPEPGSWRLEQGDQPARGTASYRDGSSDDWRQQLASQGNDGGGGAQAAGPSAFPKFRPSDTAGAQGGGGDAPASPRARGSAVVERGSAVVDRGSAVVGRGSAVVEAVEARPREELLVGTGTRGGGSSWQEPPDTQWPPRRAVETGGMQRASAAVAGPYERRPVGALMDQSGRQRSPLESDEDLEDDPGGPAAAVGFTAAWYSVPVVLFVIYMLVLDGAQQSQALQTLASAAPQFGLSLILSMVVAVGLRWASGTWKAASVGLAAAVMGGGLATVLNSAITGQSLS